MPHVVEPLTADARPGLRPNECRIETAPPDGPFKIWVTNLATGKTATQVGGPYGEPVEFHHPDEAAPGGSSGGANADAVHVLGRQRTSRPQQIDALLRLDVADS